MRKQVTEYGVFTTKIQVAILILGLVMLWTGTTFGWAAIAHYEIAKMEVGADLAKYAQLPDYKDSYDKLMFNLHWNDPAALLEPSFVELVDVNDYFCWGHGVQDKGEIGAFGVPLRPVYGDNEVDDGRYPGPMMWELIQRKVKEIPSDRKSILEKVAKGWRIHNAGDRVVHFSYFMAAQSGQTQTQQVSAWIMDHAFKELWADFMLYFIAHFEGDPDLSFKPSAGPFGKLRIVSEYSDGVPVFGRFSEDDLNAMAALVQLAQRVYRKNRFAMEAAKDEGSLEVEDIDTIKNAYKGNVVAETTRKKLEDQHTCFRWILLDSLAQARGWDDPIELNSRIEAAKTKIREWVGQMQ